jgi:hypothetical protein
MKQILFAVGLILTTFFFAQAQNSPYGLPAGAKVLETQNLNSTTHANRALILWMINAKRYPRSDPQEIYTCPEETTGHFYQGAVRVSLVNTVDKKIINTQVVKDEQGEDRFNIPYKIHRSYYFVAGVRGRQEGKPTIMKLKDYNGDGRVAEFALFDAIACMGLSTTLIGYSEKQDKVIQYETELTRTLNGKKTKENLTWIDYLFSRTSDKPGYWKYEIDYRGRGGSLDKYEVRYNMAKERFEATLISKTDD